MLEFPFTEDELIQIDGFLSDLYPHAKNISGELQHARQVIGSLRSCLAGADSWQTLRDRLNDYDAYIHQPGCLQSPD
jgi:hypothetical protein